MNKSLLKSFLPILVLVIFFIACSYFAQNYEEYYLDTIKSEGMLGIFVYIIVCILSTVVAPLSNLPLIPLASNIWGPNITALTSIVGWMIGSIIAFYLSRKYGRDLVEKIVSKEKLDNLENKIPNKNIFWTILLLRMIVPVDILSYALGLFKKISWKVYLLATFIGIFPFAFVFSYLGTLPFKYQIVGMIPSLLILFFIYRRSR